MNLGPLKASFCQGKEEASFSHSLLSHMVTGPDGLQAGLPSILSSSSPKPFQPVPSFHQLPPQPSAIPYFPSGGKVRVRLSQLNLAHQQSAENNDSGSSSETQYVSPILQPPGSPLLPSLIKKSTKLQGSIPGHC